MLQNNQLKQKSSQQQLTEYVGGASKISKVKEAAAQIQQTERGKTASGDVKSINSIVSALRNYTFKYYKSYTDNDSLFVDNEHHVRGTPLAAAKKAVGIITRGDKPSFGYPDGIKNAFYLVLTEKTRGVRKREVDPETDSKKYVRKYFIWRELLQDPKVVERTDASGNVKNINIKWKHYAIPARDAKNAADALKKSKRS